MVNENQSNPLAKLLVEGNLFFVFFVPLLR